MTRHFFKKTDSVHKSWSISVAENLLTITQVTDYNDPRITQKKLKSAAECEKETDTLIAGKLEDGFEEVPLDIPGVPVATLYEVYKTKLNKSTELELYHTGGSEALMEFLCTLTWLKKLLMYRVPVLPDAIRNLTNLESLSIDMSPSLSKIPDSIGELHNLYTLSVGHTAIRELPDSIGNLANLGTLTVHSNHQLSGLPHTIGKLQKLHMLTAFLNRNSLEAPSFFIPDSVGDLHTLERLNLSKNNLSSLPETLVNLQELTLIELENNLFTEMPALVFQLPNLYLIGMDNCRITHIPRELCDLKELEYVNLENNEITNVPKEIIEEGWEAIRSFLEGDNTPDIQPKSNNKPDPMEMLVKEFQAAHGAVLPPVLKQFILDGGMHSKPSFTFMDGEQERNGVFATDIGSRSGGMADQLLRITVGRLAKKTEPIGFADVKPIQTPDDYNYQLIVFPKYGFPAPVDEDPYPVYLVKYKGYPNEDEEEDEEEMESDFDCSIHKVAESVKEFIAGIK